MRFIADLQIHSKHSRATSSRMILSVLDAMARRKGILVMGTGDATHPLWVKELKSQLEPAETGLFKLKTAQGRDFTRFMLTAEVSLIYKRLGKVRKVHHLLFFPDFKALDTFNAALSKVGNLMSDGRPIIGLDSEKMAAMLFSTNPDNVLIPAHAWTPWFSVFGARSGFDTLEECFGRHTDKIFAVETGLSSDPPMNWRLSQLNQITLISNSDAHSPEKIGREANTFDCELSYQGIIDAIKTADPKKFLMTLEFFPEEGKYHFPGHRACGVRLTPTAAQKQHGLCHKCGRYFTDGVLSRVAALADRPAGHKSSRALPFKHLIPLQEIIAAALGTGVATKAVQGLYGRLTDTLAPEFEVLLNTKISDIEKVAGTLIAEGINRVRQGRVNIEPGYDGEFGKINVFTAAERLAGGAKQLARQARLL